MLLHALDKDGSVRGESNPSALTFQLMLTVIGMELSIIAHYQTVILNGLTLSQMLMMNRRPRYSELEGDGLVESLQKSLEEQLESLKKLTPYEVLEQNINQKI